MRFNFFILLFLVVTQLQAQDFYKTPSGKKFHTATCRMVENVSKKVNEDEINAYGLTACKICKPSYVGRTAGFTNKSVGKSYAVRCKGVTKKGTRCKHQTKLANGFCYQHTKQSNTTSIKSIKSYSSTCGARTKSGGSCKRKVKGGVRCYQHR